uniref:Reverse transcriptase n=1 Tax=Ascaris lumbricoides TaxID=6252 RepID=A0A0M3HF50_ASCLU
MQSHDQKVQDIHYETKAGYDCSRRQNIGRDAKGLVCHNLHKKFALIVALDVSVDWAISSAVKERRLPMERPISISLACGDYC